MLKQSKTECKRPLAPRMLGKRSSSYIITSETGRWFWASESAYLEWDCKKESFLRHVSGLSISYWQLYRVLQYLDSSHLTVVHLTLLPDPACNFWRVQSKHFRVLFPGIWSTVLPWEVLNLDQAVPQAANQSSLVFPQLWVLQLTGASGLLQLLTHSQDTDEIGALPNSN